MIVERMKDLGANNNTAFSRETSVDVRRESGSAKELEKRYRYLKSNSAGRFEA